MKKRLDVLLVERGLADSRAKAQALVLAGRVPGHSKAGSQVATDADLAVLEGPRYVSRGGDKLVGALEDFELDVEGLVCADIGASTGGFTHCLLDAGAARVCAIDFCYGQLDTHLRDDPRVDVLERTNARSLAPGDIPVAPALITCDVSFISFRLVVAPLVACAAAGWKAIVLLKPQFEAGPKLVGKGGVVRDPAVHRTVLVEACGWVDEQGWSVRGVEPSRVQGAKGNQEFFVLIESGRAESALSFVEAALQKAAGV
ncbi:MAG: TlyA family RNA methyltransferase [Gaiellaceae bacterium]